MRISEDPYRQYYEHEREFQPGLPGWDDLTGEQRIEWQRRYRAWLKSGKADDPAGESQPK